ncbi:MAG: hypothetical protein LBH74_07505 [Nitrososphaerota archaeon]|jgi:hypothetical protein|uniref:hypothetical protein n=1 Tax=Candidatus Bathycorpusculum sp. TaxID=2994959 RepID=UPI00281924FA|nr:hypothetical protein [Candidatus Termitimicrobium sp.]MCL2432026.1 hypothetical protein [Candidatus Termitimicrobium sp.]MDR0493465.1 hypothetical protein [Nitrososphaerota archaeon]
MSLVVVGVGICVVAVMYVIVKLSTPTKAEREKEILALIEQYMNPNGEKKHMIDGVEVEVDKNGYIKKSR